MAEAKREAQDELNFALLRSCYTSDEGDTHLLCKLDEVGFVASRPRFEPCVYNEDDKEKFEEGARRVILMTALDVSP